MNTKDRISYWDNIKGFLIILVVFAHIIMPFQNNAIMDSMFDYTISDEKQAEFDNAFSIIFAGDLFVNVNDYIVEQLRYDSDKKYLQDHIHPNAGKGVVMYSEAVLLSSD